MLGKRAVLAAGVLYCKMPCAGFMLLKWAKEGETHEISARVPDVPERRSFYSDFHLSSLLYLSSSGNELVWGCLIFTFPFEWMGTGVWC
jgi:hypothetical protein